MLRRPAAVAAVALAALLAACAGGGAADPVDPPAPAETAETAGTEAAGTSVLVPATDRPAPSPAPTTAEDKSEPALELPGVSAGGADVGRGGASAVRISAPDLRADSLLLSTTFNEGDEPIAAFDGRRGTGGYGSLEDNRFYEVVVEAADAHVASPILGVPPAPGDAVLVDVTSFILNFTGESTMARGVYCWAPDAPDVVDVPRYELTFDAAGVVRLTRWTGRGEGTVLLERDYPFEDTETPEEARGVATTGLLCRPGPDGTSATLALYVEDLWYLVRDPEPIDPAPGVGLITIGEGEDAIDAVATFDSLNVADASAVVLPE